MTSAIETRSIERLIVPVDESAGSVRALPVALRLAERSIAPLELLAVVPEGQSTDAIRRRLDELALQCGDAVTSTEVVEASEPATEVARRCAARPGSAIVMSDHGPSRTSGVLEESLATELLADGLSLVLVGPEAAAEASDLPVVACIDGSAESEQVVPVAVAWADLLHVPLVLVMVAPTPLQAIPGTTPVVEPGRFDPGVVVQDAVTRVAAAWPRLEVIGRVVTYPWNVADALTIYLGRHPSQLVAVATHVREGWARLIHPSTTARIVRQIGTPLLVVPIEPLSTGAEPPPHLDQPAHPPAPPVVHPFEQVIVPIDPDREVPEAAVATARHLAMIGGAEISFWACYATAGDLLAGNESRRAGLTEAVRPVRARWNATRGDEVADALIEFAASGPDSVICLATNAPGRLIDTVAPTTTGQMLRWSPRTVVLVGPHCRPDEPFDAIVGCIDGSLISEAVAELTGSWARAFGVPARLLAVVDPDVADAGPPVIGRYIERLATRIARRHGIAADARIVSGTEVAATICDWAENHPGALLVMASHGTGLSEHVLGGVVMDVVRHAHRPVVVVPAHTAGGFVPPPAPHPA